MAPESCFNGERVNLEVIEVAGGAWTDVLRDHGSLCRKRQGSKVRWSRRSREKLLHVVVEWGICVKEKRYARGVKTRMIHNLDLRSDKVQQRSNV